MLSYRNIILGEAAYGGLPVAYWSLQEVTGTTVIDEMTVARGTGYTGSYNGGYTQQRLGPINREPSNGVLFNGTTGYITTGTLGNFLGSANSTGFSLEAWFKTTVTNVRMAIMGAFSASTTNGIQLVLNSDTTGAIDANKIICTVIDTSATTDLVTAGTGAISAMSDGAWHHLVATSPGTFNSSGFNLYFDGVSQTFTTTAIGTPGGVSNLATALAIAARDIAGTRTLFFSGSLAHVAVYPYALAADRINYHYLAGKNGINRMIAA